MTENTVAMGGTALAEPPAPVLPLDSDEQGSSGDRRKLMIVGAAVGVLVLLVVAFFMMKGGSNTPPASSGSPVFTHPAAAAPKSGQKAHATKPVKLPKAYNGRVGRDPFKPLYVAPAPAASQAPNGSTSGTQNNSNGGDPGGVGSTVTPPTTQPSTTSLGRPVWVELVKVDGTKSATFMVGYSNGKRLTTRTFGDVLAPKGATGTIFAKLFTLLSLQNGEATIQFGDGTPLDIAPGAANRVVVS